MAIRILTVPFSIDKEIFEDEDASLFLLNKHVKELKAELFMMHGIPYWSVFVNYEILVDKADDSVVEGLDEGQKLLYTRLRQWRKERGDKEKVPYYIIANNSQLINLVRAAPQTLAALSEVNGFGKKKVDAYGKEIIDIIKAFHEKKQVSKNKEQPQKTDKPTQNQPADKTDSAKEQANSTSPQTTNQSDKAEKQDK